MQTHDPRTDLLKLGSEILFESYEDSSNLNVHHEHKCINIVKTECNLLNVKIFVLLFFKTL